MSYPKRLLRLRPTKGFVSDTPPHEVGSDFWTGCNNVHFREGFAERIPGHRSGYSTALAIANPSQLRHAVNAELSDTNYWVLIEADGSVWAIEGNNATQIDGSLFQSVANPYQYSSALLNGIPLISNGTDEPVYWPGSGAMLTLPGWTATESCGFIAVLKYHAFALNISGPGGIFPNLVKWSAATEPGTVPGEWTPSANNDAGSAELSDSPGGLLCGSPLNDSLMIYKRSATYKAKWVGGNRIFDIRKVSSSSGALTPRSVCDIGGKHFIVSDGDVLISDGTTDKPIAEGRVRDYLFNQLDQTHYRNLFCSYNRGQGEVLIGFPTAGSEFCNTALTYDVSTDSFGVRDLVNVVHAPTGFLNDDTPSNTYADRTDTYAEATDVYGSSTIEAARDSLVLVDETSLEQQDTGDSVVIGASIGKHGLTFGEPARLKFVKTVHIRTAQDPGDLLVRIGGSMTPNGIVTWSAEVPLNDGEQIVNAFAMGRYISVEVRSNSDRVWKLTAIELEAELRGYY